MRRLLSAPVLAVLFIVSCAQPGIETYGCACDSRTYTQVELSGYRAGALRGDLKSLKEMQEYYAWRGDEQKPGDPGYLVNMQTSRMFFERRLAELDPEAIGQFVDEVTCYRDHKHPDQLALTEMKRAYRLVSQLKRKIIATDCDDDQRREIEASTYLRREIGALEVTLRSGNHSRPQAS